MKNLNQLNLFEDATPEGSGGEVAPKLAASERGLVAIAMALGARDVSGWSQAEESLVAGLPAALADEVAEFRRSIQFGDDPLGDAFCKIRSPAERRPRGATYTPRGIVRSMVEWASGQSTPDRVVDPGLGSGRFLVEAGHRFPGASLIGIELDPVPALLARANLAAHGLAPRARVILGDYREVRLNPISGRTLFIGNPPYVRHHLLGPRWKEWLVREARHRRLAASQLAGLHVYFYLATVLKAKPGDFGTFITAAEWLDVNYGSLVRDLFMGALGGNRIVVIEPTALPFADAATTAAITGFEIGSRPATVLLKRATSLDDLQTPGDEHEVDRNRLESEKRWSHLTRPARKGPLGYVELGEFCRVHRGQVTGANKFWIEGEHSTELPPSVLIPSVTRAKELFRAGRVLQDSTTLKRVIDLPVDYDRFTGAEWVAVDRFLARARRLGVSGGYVAKNRKAWWSVGLHKPAPILATYMARRPPAFVRNQADARHINIAHGIYPNFDLGEDRLTRLIEHLSTATSLHDGRTYAGGLTKFEPREMERLLVPSPELLGEGLN